MRPSLGRSAPGGPEDGPDLEEWHARRALLPWERVGFLALFAAGLYYHVKGYYWLVYHDLGALDLRFRWLEQQIVLSGSNPFDVAAAVRAGRAVPDALLQYVVGLTVGYPPWAYFAGTLFLWPPWAASRVLYAGLNVVATARIGPS